MRIVECYEQMSRRQDFVTFEDVIAEKRAEFVTFHQAYSYEEFEEGIRPVLADDEQEEGSQDLKYKIEDGILKRMANAASIEFIKGEDAKGTETISEPSKIWKISLGARYKEEHIYQFCKKNAMVAIGWLNDQSLEGVTYEEIYAALLPDDDKGYLPKPTNDTSTINYMVNEMKPGDVVLVFEGQRTIRDIVVVAGDYCYQKDEMIFPHRRKVKWLWLMQQLTTAPIFIWFTRPFPAMPLPTVNWLNLRSMSPTTMFPLKSFN